MERRPGKTTGEIHISKNIMLQHFKNKHYYSDIFKYTALRNIIPPTVCHTRVSAEPLGFSKKPPQEEAPTISCPSSGRPRSARPGLKNHFLMNVHNLTSSKFYFMSQPKTHFGPSQILQNHTCIVRETGFGASTF